MGDEMGDKFNLDDECPSLIVLDQVADSIATDGRALGPWARMTTEIQMRQRTRPYYMQNDDYPSRRTVTLDGHPRNPKFFEKIRGLTPMPPIVQITWVSDTELRISGWTSADSSYESTIEVTPERNSDAVAQTLAEVATAFRSIDPSKTEAIKVYDAPASLEGVMSQGKFADMATDQASRTVRF